MEALGSEASSLGCETARAIPLDSAGTCSQSAALGVKGEESLMAQALDCEDSARAPIGRDNSRMAPACEVTALTLGRIKSRDATRGGEGSRTMAFGGTETCRISGPGRSTSRASFAADISGQRAPARSMRSMPSARSCTSGGDSVHGG